MCSGMSTPMIISDDTISFRTFCQAVRQISVMVDPVADSSVAPWLTALVRDSWPGARIRINVGGLPGKAYRLQSGEIDFGLRYSFREQIDPGFAYQVLFEDPMVVLVRETHVLALRKSMRMEALRGERWILPSLHYMPYIRRVLIWETQRAGFLASKLPIPQRVPFIDALTGAFGLSLAPSGFLRHCPPEIRGPNSERRKSVEFLGSTASASALQ